MSIQLKQLFRSPAKPASAQEYGQVQLNNQAELINKVSDDVLEKLSSPEPEINEAKNPSNKKTSFLPLEELIKKQKLKPFHEQLLINISNLATAYAVSDSANALKISPFINLPASFAFMHLTNKGIKDLDKLACTSITGIGAIALQRAFKLPKWLLKTLISSVIFTINNKKINFPMSILDPSRFKARQKDLIPLLKKFFKIETIIHSVPNIVNPLMRLAENKFVKENDSANKYGFALAIYLIKVLGLSGGFVGLGNFMHKSLGMGGKGKMEGLTEMLVGACPAEIASSTKAILLPD